MSTSSPAASRPPSSDGPSPWRVVLVDDDAPLRALLRHVVDGDARFEVVAEAVDGVTALAAVETHAPDLLLLDLVMPRLDGLGVLRQLRTTPDTAPVVVVFTGLDQAHADEAVEHGAAAAYTKAIAFEALTDRLAELLPADAAHGRLNRRDAARTP